jgi:hypothetical protein
MADMALSPHLEASPNMTTITSAYHVPSYEVSQGIAILLQLKGACLTEASFFGSPTVPTTVIPTEFQRLKPSLKRLEDPTLGRDKGLTSSRRVHCFVRGAMHAVRSLHSHQQHPFRSPHLPYLYARAPAVSTLFQSSPSNALRSLSLRVPVLSISALLLAKPGNS